jgi:hypothetical protein
MEVTESGRVTVPSPLFIDPFSKPRGGNRHRPEPTPTPLLMFGWAASQSIPYRKTGGPAEVELIDQDGNHADPA